MHTIQGRPYEEMLALHDKCKAFIEAGPEDLSKEEHLLRMSVASGIYRHFKSTPESPKFYIVYGVGPGVNDRFRNDYNVSYEALYPPHGGDLTWRELTGDDGFLMPVDRTLADGSHYRGERFVPVALCKRADLAQKAEAYRTY